jgi:integrase
MRPAQRAHAEVTSLYSPNGERKYLNADERRRVLAALDALAPERALFVALLAWAGARPSELLDLTRESFQVHESVVSIRTLKRRSFNVREVPIPPALMRALDLHFGLSKDDVPTGAKLFPWSRTTAWRIVKSVMNRAGVSGVGACPKGLRHGFGTAAISCVPLNIVSRWLGHADLATTAIYAAAIGPEEFAFAERFWRLSEEAMPAAEVHASRS